MGCIFSCFKFPEEPYEPLFFYLTDSSSDYPDYVDYSTDGASSENHYDHCD